MTPTPKLRFVERDSYSHNGEHFREPHKVRILQQYCEDYSRILRVTQSGDGPWVNHYAGEWRDVPLEKEA